jgi:hypothetical protein
VKEDLMNDTEETARRLFAVATEDIPPGIDLLRGVRARSRKRVVRVRAGVAAGAAGVVAAAAITLSAVPAPSAFAQVKQAVARTAATSYQVRSAQKIVRVGGLRSKPWATAYGEFDLARGVGEQTDNRDDQIRYVDGYTYILVGDDLRGDPNSPIPAWASWERLPGNPLQPGGEATPTELGTVSFSSAMLWVFDPRDLLALLQSATGVREVGPASGPGWTGTAYAFTVDRNLDGPLHTASDLSGTIDVDQQGWVRQLDALDTFMNTVSQVKISFGDFGLPVSVSPPPASETYIPPGP